MNGSIASYAKTRSSRQSTGGDSSKSVAPKTAGTLKRFANNLFPEMPMSSVNQSRRRYTTLSLVFGVLPVKKRAATRRRHAMCWCVVGCAAVIATPLTARAEAPFHGQLEVSSQGLCIKGIVFRKMIPMSDLQVSLARIVDLDQEPSLRPWMKLYGIGLPGFRSGWFLLKERERALLVLSRSNLAVYVPTSRGYALLLSPERIEEFLTALKNPTPNEQVFSVIPGKGER